MNTWNRDNLYTQCSEPNERKNLHTKTKNLRNSKRIFYTDITVNYISDI